MGGVTDPGALGENAKFLRFLGFDHLVMDGTESVAIDWN